MKMRPFLLVVSALLLLACGPKKTSQPALRSFPMAEVPAMLTAPEDRMLWLGAHFWDRFTDTLQLYTCDSLVINGVQKEEVEKQMGIFATIVPELPPSEGVKDMQLFLGRLEAFQRAHPGSNMLKAMADITAFYFYDPNSPLRSEDLYLPFVSGLSRSAYIDPAYRMGYQWDANMCQMNRTGTPAADFTFVDTKGRTRTLYQVKAPYTLLIFGNPDCHSCKELMESMAESELISELLDKGTVRVVDIYIDQDIDLWKERMADYPTAWINGYDPTFTIRGDVLYNVRALPSLYLLDKDKTVLLKDAETAQVLDSLAALEQVQ